MLRTAGRFLFFLIIVATAGVMSSCGTPDVLFISDPFLVETSGSEAAFRADVQSAAAEAGVRVTGVVLEGAENLLEKAEELITGSDAAAVALSPLFVNHLGELGNRYPEKTFILAGVYGETPVQAGPKSVVVRIDRQRAFAEAGKFAAAEGKKLEADEQGEARVAALFYTGNAIRKNEMQAFVTGYGEERDRSTLIVREMPSQRRPEEVKAMMDEVKSRGVAVIFLALGAMNSFGMENVQSDEVKIITERTAASGAYQKKIVASIEDNYFGALAEGLAAYRKGLSGPLSVDAYLRTDHSSSDGKTKD